MSYPGHPPFTFSPHKLSPSQAHVDEIWSHPIIRQGQDATVIGEDEILNNTGSGIPHPPFKPLFTLIHDNATGQYHHPSVHYLFSDDDPEIITEAAMRSVEGPGSSSHVSRMGKHSEEREQEVDNEELEGSSLRQSLLPPPIPGVQEHYVVLDVEPTRSDQALGPSTATVVNVKDGAGAVQPSIATSPPSAGLAASAKTTTPHQQPQQHFAVASAHSLSPAWQVVDSRISAAPTFDSDSSTAGANEAGGGLMLQIDGTSGLSPGANKNQGLEEMLFHFQQRMVELQQVIEASGTSAANTDALGKEEETKEK